MKADGLIVVAHGPADEMARAKAILQSSDPKRLDQREGVTPVAPA